MRIVGYAALICGWAWLAGVALGDRVAVPNALPLAAFLGAIGAVAVVYRPASLRPLLPFALAALLLGNARFVAADSLLVDELQPFAGQHVVVVGTVVEGASPSVASERATVEVEGLADEEGNQHEVRDRLVVYSPPFTDLRAGERLRLVGTLRPPASLDGFDRVAYLAGHGVHATISQQQIERLAAPRNGIESALDLARKQVNGALARVLPEPVGGIAQGLVTGERAALSEETRGAFARTNTTHLLAVSGTNVALVVAAVQPLLASLHRRRLAFAGTILAIAAYAALVGAQPSAMRAAAMGGLVAWARLIGRQSDAHTALAVVGAVMTALNPLWICDLGFQLSFLATAGLLFLGHGLETRLQPLPPVVREPFALTLAATLAVLPVLARSTDQVSLVGPLVNLLVGPLVGPTTVLALLLAPLALLSTAAAAPLAWVEWLLLSTLERVVVLGSGLPFASLPSGWLALSVVCLYYAALAAMALGGANSPLVGLWPSARGVWTAVGSRMPAGRLCLALVVLAGVTWAGALAGPPATPVLTFLNVGQGDATLIQMPDGRVVLVDGGPTPNSAVQALDRRLPFWRRRVDLLILTHPHDDHLVGLVEIVRRYDVGAVMESGLAGSTPAWESFGSALAEKQTPRHRARVGDTVDLGDSLKLSVLAAGASIAASDGSDATPVVAETNASRAGDAEVNDSSLMLRLDSPAGVVMLTGDAGPTVQRRLLEEGMPLHAAVLKVPHHGAANCLDADFLRAVGPSVVVVSVGAGNHFGHPAAETTKMLVDGGSRVFRTDDNGSVEIELSVGGLRVGTER